MYIGNIYIYVYKLTALYKHKLFIEEPNFRKITYYKNQQNKEMDKINITKYTIISNNLVLVCLFVLVSRNALREGWTI